MASEGDRISAVCFLACNKFNSLPYIPTTVCNKIISLDRLKNVEKLICIIFHPSHWREFAYILKSAKYRYIRDKLSTILLVLDKAGDDSQYLIFSEYIR